MTFVAVYGRSDPCERALAEVDYLHNVGFCVNCGFDTIEQLKEYPDGTNVVPVNFSQSPWAGSYKARALRNNMPIHFTHHQKLAAFPTLPRLPRFRLNIDICSFYRAMHFSAKRGIAIACRLSVCPSVCPSVCNVGGL